MTTSQAPVNKDEHISLVERAFGGDRRALARLISRIERDDQLGRELLRQVYPRSGQAHRIGITGPPGAGKSSLIGRLVTAYRRQNRRVGVICVDPTSPFSGGATLGDRIRLMDHHADPNVYVRSMASRGHHGGLAATTAAVAHVLDASGFDPILIETLGVGQDETEIRGLAHTVVVLQVPGLGDTIQTLKAGVLEIADILVVNKADLPEADRLVRDLAGMISLADRPLPSDWRVKLVRASATADPGVDDLIEAIQSHRRWLDEAGAWHERQRQLAATELMTALRRALEERLHGNATNEWAEVVEAVATRQGTPAEAVNRLLARLQEGSENVCPSSTWP
jgi:LAO/AO transport system kinase